MLSKSEKFTTEDFVTIKNLKGQKIHTEYGFFVVYKLLPPRKAIVVSSKNFKTAVLRNKYKRIFYQAVQDFQKVEPKIAKLSFVFYPRKVFTKDELVLQFKTCLPL